MCLPGCLFVCHLILLLVCFLFNLKSQYSLYLEFIPKGGLFHKMLLLSLMGFLNGWCNHEVGTFGKQTLGYNSPVQCKTVVTDIFPEIDIIVLHYWCCPLAAGIITASNSCSFTDFPNARLL